MCAHIHTHSQEAQPTPCIDNILRNYQQRNLAGHKINEPAAAVENGGYEGRLFLLEKQLTDLLQRSKVSHSYSMIYFCYMPTEEDVVVNIGRYKLYQAYD